MTHNQNTITHHYQQLQSYERGLIMAQQSDGWSCRRRAACHSVSWSLKAPEFFRQLVMELRQKPRVHSVDSFVHWFKLNHPELTCPSTPTVYLYIDEGRLELTNSELPVKLRRRVKSDHKAHHRMNKHTLG